MEELLNEITYDIPIELKYRILLENLIWKSDYSQFDILKILIEKINKDYIQQLIFHVSQFNIFSYKFLGDLFAETKNLVIKLTFNPFFCDYLYNRKLLKEEDIFFEINSSVFLSIDEYENPIKEETIWSIIRNDDINNFTSFITLNETNLNLEHIRIFQTTFYLKDFVVYCGALNIAKYLILNNQSFDNFYTIKFAIQGGNEEMIEFLFDRGYKFDQQLINSIAFHQNKIAIWLFQKYKNNINYNKCIQTYNTEMFIYFLFEKQIDLNNLNLDDETFIECAAKYNNIDLYNYLINIKQKL